MTESYPFWICSDCGKKHGRPVIPISTYHEGICGWCGERKAVTEPRDWGWPEFGGEKSK